MRTGLGPRVSRIRVLGREARPGFRGLDRARRPACRPCLCSPPEEETCSERVQREEMSRPAHQFFLETQKQANEH